ncbi:MAG TPA: SPOR domain-containing protein [Rhodanobacteraceae bacterium]|nr:SPOR domain-containing protein [Rhodanobacteraceae bacterium]
MQPALKTRLLGAAVLIALAVIVVPLFFSGKPGGDGSQSISLDIPQTPDQALKTRTMSVATSPQPASTIAPDNHLATVDIPSRVPPEVMPDQSTVQQDAAETGRVATPASHPADDKASTEKPKATSPDETKAAEANPGRAAVANYQINLGAYANKSNAERLMAKVSKMGYPVQLSGVSIDGKPAARVDVGPFDSRATAERARLKLHAALPHAPAKLVSAPVDQQGNAPAKAQPKHQAGGYAVQVVAYSKRADADKLRDRLRKAGFDSYVDDVKSGNQTLWRVRVGPMTQHDDAASTAKRITSKFSRLKAVVVTVP